MSPTRQRFVHEYVVDLNASAAHQRAGYKATDNAAEVNAYRLLSNAQVRAAIHKVRQAMARRLEVMQENILREYARIGFIRLDDVATWSETGLIPKPSAELTADQTAAIAEISDTTTESAHRCG